MTRYAIIMSVENYKHFLPTKFTHADSDLIHHTLTKMCDYAEQHTIIFKLSPNNSKSPTEILSEIKGAVSNSISGDSILFFFAGHGHYQEGKTRASKLARKLFPVSGPKSFWLNGCHAWLRRISRGPKTGKIIGVILGLFGRPKVKLT